MSKKHKKKMKHIAPLETTNIFPNTKCKKDKQPTRSIASHENREKKALLCLAGMIFFAVIVYILSCNSLSEVCAALVSVFIIGVFTALMFWHLTD